LDGGMDGLDVQRGVIASAPLWLAPAGTLLIETSDRQAAHTADLVARAGMQARVVSSDELDATVVIGVS
jgi:release factor glutamine methyltransferase